MEKQQKKSNLIEVLEEEEIEWRQRWIMAENFLERIKDNKSRLFNKAQARQIKVSSYLDIL